MADYALAGLVAADVGAVAVKKPGLLAPVPGFGKKFVILFDGSGSQLKRMFGRRGAAE